MDLTIHILINNSYHKKVFANFILWSKTETNCLLLVPWHLWPLRPGGCKHLNSCNLLLRCVKCSSRVKWYQLIKEDRNYLPYVWCIVYHFTKSYVMLFKRSYVCQNLITPIAFLYFNINFEDGIFRLVMKGCLVKR